LVAGADFFKDLFLYNWSTRLMLLDWEASKPFTMLYTDQFFDINRVEKIAIIKSQIE